MDEAITIVLADLEVNLSLYNLYPADSDWFAIAWFETPWFTEKGILSGLPACWQVTVTI